MIGAHDVRDMPIGVPAWYLKTTGAVEPVLLLLC